jgi:hypothetical protein
MVLSRSRLRLPAAFVTGLLLLMGAGEILGVCYCTHRGGQPMSGHTPASAESADAQTHPADHLGHGGSPQVPTSDTGAPDSSHDEHGSDHPAGEACKALCALACSLSPNPAPDAAEGRDVLLRVAHLVPRGPIESKDLVPLTARPHVLPLSQAPPTKV